MHLPANTWGARAETVGASGATGTTLTGGTANTKGSWTTLITATSFAYEGMAVYLFNHASQADYVVDIGIDDGSGNVFVLIENLRLCGLQFATEHLSCFYVPVHVAAGAKIVARTAGTVNSNTIVCTAVGFSANPGGYPGFSRAICLNSISSSRGVTIDPGGTANTKGSWTEITSSTPVALGGLFMSVGANNDVSRSSTALGLLDIGLGAGGSEFVLLADRAMSWDSNMDSPQSVNYQAVSCAIPAGTRVAARMESTENSAGDRTIDLCVYGLVA